MGYIEQLELLAKECDTEEQELIEEMIVNAAEYVRSVIVMETAARNLLGRAAEEYRDDVSAKECSRTMTHNALISEVNIVKRICVNHGQKMIYEGDNERRHYGDFAMELTAEIFGERK